MLGNSGYPYDAVERKWIAQYASLHDLILMFGHSNQCRQAGGGWGDFVCWRVSARFLHGFCTVSKRAKGANRCKIGQRVQKLETKNLRCIAEK